MADYRLYAHKNSYAMTTHLMLEELGVEYDVTWFNVHKPDEFPPEFLQLNPNAKVPVLVTPDGAVYESAATLMYLSEHHDNRFMPTDQGPRGPSSLIPLANHGILPSVPDHRTNLKCAVSESLTVLEENTIWILSHPWLLSVELRSTGYC
jgi:hypothetical protein